MAGQIVITRQAQSQLLNALEYLYKRTGNKKYSTRLNQNFQRIFKMILQYPHIGREVTLKDFTEVPENFEQLASVRFFVYQQYQVFTWSTSQMKTPP